VSINSLHINEQIICRLKIEICKLIAVPLLLGNYLSKIKISLTCMKMLSIKPSKKGEVQVVLASRDKVASNKKEL